MTKLEIGKMLIDYKNDRTNYGSMLKAIDAYASMAKPNVDYSFACQRSIEGNSGCDIQCDHCKQYYSPLQKLNVSGETINDVKDVWKAGFRSERGWASNIHVANDQLIDWLAEKHLLQQSNVSGDVFELLTEIRQRLLIDINENGEPNSSMNELFQMWDRVNTALTANN